MKGGDLRKENKLFMMITVENDEVMVAFLSFDTTTTIIHDNKIEFRLEM